MALFSKNKEKVFSNIQHVVGLSVPEDCDCQVTATQKGIIILCLGSEMLIEYEKIKHVEFQVDIDEKQFKHHSLAKGIVGAVTFGATGAVLGSIPKTKTKREVTGYSFITYTDSEESKTTIVFRDKQSNSLVCAKMVDTLNSKMCK